MCRRLSSLSMSSVSGMMRAPLASRFLDLNIASNARAISTTCSLFGEPLKKKKKIDPELLKHKTEKKIRRLERDLAVLKRTPKQLKPVSEVQPSPQFLRSLETRRRELTPDEQTILDQDRELTNKLLKLWSIYKSLQWQLEYRCLERMIASQNHALNQLKEESEGLYDAALQIEPDFLPYSDFPVKKETAPIVNYVPPDGEKKDVTKQWSM